MRAVIKLDLKTKKVEGFTSLEAFFERYKEYKNKLDTINYYLTRKRTYFEDDKIRLYRITVKDRVIKRKSKGLRKDDNST